MLDTYIETLPKRPLLTREKEAALLKRAQRAAQIRDEKVPPFDARDEDALIDGDAAQAVLVESFLYKVVKEAKSMYDRNGKTVALDQLVAAGNEGLVRAVSRYDASRGTRFWTCAYWWVKDCMSREIRQWRWPVAISDDSYRNALKLMRASSTLWVDLASSPTDEELAEKLGWELEQVRKTRHELTLNDVLSIERPMGEGGKSTFADFLADERGMYGGDPNLADVQPDSVGAAASLEALRGTVRSCVDALPEREREVLNLRFGLSDGRSRTLSDVGERMGISGERARQIQESAVEHLCEGPLAAQLDRTDN